MRQHEINEDTSIANEPSVSYEKRGAINQLLDFDGRDTLEIGGDVLDEIPKMINLPVSDIAELLEISRPNYYRKRNEQQLEFKTVDKLSSILKIFQLGKEAFSSLADFRKWLTIENQSLGNIPPISLLKSEQGRRRLEDIIGRIEHGIYA